MLEQLRKKSQSVIIWVLFGIIIAVFIVSFGPQAGQTGGCGGKPTAPYVVKVGGVEVKETSWRVGMNALGAGASGGRARAMRARETVMDALIERELLAQAAENSGFRLDDDRVNAKIAAGEFYVLGQRGPGEFYYFQDGAFSYEALERYAQTLGLGSVRQFLGEQRREQLAASMRGVLMGSVRVSSDEVLARYLQEHTTVTVDFVRFDWARYAGQELSADDLAKYLAEHEAEVKKKYEADERVFKGVPPQLRARHVFLRRTAPAPDAPVPPPGEAPIEPVVPAVPVVPAPVDPARGRAEAVLARLQGGADFAAVARELSEDDRSKNKGGDLGWRSVRSLGWGPELSEAAQKLQPGELSAVVETARGYHVLRIDAKREGDLSYDQVKEELAERLARDHFAKERARRDAEAALARVKAGAKLAELFPREAPPAGAPGAPGDPAEGEEQGAIVREGPNVPAELAGWSDDDGERLLAQGDQPPAGGAPPGGAPRVRRVAPPAAPAAGAPVADPDQPKLTKAGPIQRNGDVVAGPGLNPYVGKSPELSKALFDELDVDQVADRIFEVEDGFVIAQLLERAEPDMKAFAEQEQQLREQFAGERSYRTLEAWTSARCREALAAGQIVINPVYVRYEDEDPKTGQPPAVTYKPCQTDPQ